jgi:AraC-like DNA-binding protein/mannose-6-phosphate isomerase-like protein (cupin superfamily)
LNNDCNLQIKNTKIKATAGKNNERLVFGNEWLSETKFAVNLLAYTAPCTIQMKKPAISISFQKNNPTEGDDFSVIHFSGTHWDDIYYFPKNYQVGLIREGEGIFTIAGTSFLLSKQDTYFIKPGLAHKGKPNPEKGWSVTVLNFRPQIIDNLKNEGACFSIFNHFQAPASLYLKMEKLLSHFETTLLHDEAVNLVYDFLVEVGDAVKPALKSKEQHRAIVRARQFIEANYKSKFSLEDLSREVYLSKFHLLRLFKQEIGLAPYTYQLQLKLNEARKLIFQKRSLTEIAYELGFTDQAHFINTYKKYTELTPGEFLKTAIFYNSG